MEKEYTVKIYVFVKGKKEPVEYVVKVMANSSKEAYEKANQIVNQR